MSDRSGYAEATSDRWIQLSYFPRTPTDVLVFVTRTNNITFTGMPSKPDWIGVQEATFVRPPTFKTFTAL